MLTRERKREIVRYYAISKRCVCGRSKKKERWVCLECREKIIGTKKAKVLNSACQKHLQAALEILKDCKTKKKKK